jgi:hypothetical protein
MNIFERPEDRKERQKNYFLQAFRTLNREGEDWVPMTEVAPRAAWHDPIYMQRRGTVNNLLDLFGRHRETLPSGLTYPPRGYAEYIADELVAEQLVERKPNTLTRYDDGGNVRAYLYRLAPNQEPAGHQTDVGITA